MVHFRLCVVKLSFVTVSSVHVKTPGCVFLTKIVSFVYDCTTIDRNPLLILVLTISYFAAAWRISRST